MFNFYWYLAPGTWYDLVLRMCIRYAGVSHTTQQLIYVIRFYGGVVVAVAHETLSNAEDSLFYRACAVSERESLQQLVAFLPSL